MPRITLPSFRAARGAVATLAAAALLAAPLAQTASAQTTPSPTPSQTPLVIDPATVGPEDLEAIQAEIEQLSKELTLRTQKLEVANRNLDRAKLELEAAREREAVALAAAEAASAQLNALASAAYRNPGGGTELALASTPDDFLDALSVAAALNIGADGQGRVLDDLQRHQAEAEAARAEADALAAKIAAEQERIASEVRELQNRALAAQQRMSATIAALRLSAGSQPLVLGVGVPGLDVDCAGNTMPAYPNGFLPAEALCALHLVKEHGLRRPAAAAFIRMDALYRQQTGESLCITDSYRSYPAQIDVYARKPRLAAIPGRSNHGWGLALDMCGGIQNFGTEAHEWMRRNAPTFGWIHPAWAQQGGSKPEAWHWEYVGVCGYDPAANTALTTLAATRITPTNPDGTARPASPGANPATGVPPSPRPSPSRASRSSFRTASFVQSGTQESPEPSAPAEPEPSEPAPAPKPSQPAPKPSSAAPKPSQPAPRPASPSPAAQPTPAAKPSPSPSPSPTADEDSDPRGALPPPASRPKIQGCVPTVPGSEALLQIPLAEILAPRPAPAAAPAGAKPSPKPSPKR